jgi:hypothetical protein
MSYGEEYWIAWSQWYEGQPVSERAAYRKRHPEPTDWKESQFYARWDNAEMNEAAP